MVPDTGLVWVVSSGHETIVLGVSSYLTDLTGHQTAESAYISRLGPWAHLSNNYELQRSSSWWYLFDRWISLVPGVIWRKLDWQKKRDPYRFVCTRISIHQLEKLAVESAGWGCVQSVYKRNVLSQQFGFCHCPSYSLWKGPFQCTADGP